MPALELDTRQGDQQTVVSASTSDQTNPRRSAANADEKAETRMWIRRIEQRIGNPLADGFRFAEGLAMFKDRMHTMPAAAADLKAIAQEGEAWLDGLIAGRQWVCGDRFTLADIVLYCLLDFGKGVGQAVNPNAKNLLALIERIGAPTPGEPAPSREGRRCAPGTSLCRTRSS
jgi:glutathione S-transferase